MAKKRKKKKGKKGSPAPAGLPAAELEKRGAVALAASRFRQARDCYKTLYKTDPERYRAPLVEAYQGILRGMLAKGMAGEAEVVIARIREIGGGETHPDPLLLVQAALGKGDSRTASRICVEWFRDHEDAAGAEARPFADALICSLDGAVEEEKTETGAVRDAVAVREAIGALGGGRYDLVLDQIRAIGTKSACYPWKIFLKALCAYYREDDAKARALLEAVPADSPLHTAAAVWRILLGDRQALEERFRDDTLLRHICAVAGFEDRREVLARAEYLWRVNRHRDSLKTVFERFPGFPSESGDFLHSLTRFYFDAVLSMEPDQGYDYIRSVPERLNPHRGGFDRLARAGTRAIALLEERFGYDADDTREAWEDYVSAAKDSGELSPLEEALVCERIGDAYAEEAAAGGGMPPFPVPFRREPEFPEDAEKYYRRSIELYPGNRDSHKKLLRIYEQWERKRRINRTLDEMIRLFPDDADCLTRAGLLAVQRNAYNKGMDYLRRGLAVNPLDTETRERFVIGSIRTALSLARKGDGDRSLALLGPALEAGKESLHDLNLGHPYIRARWAGIALLAGRVPDSLVLYEDAVSSVPDPLYVDYFCYLLWSLYGIERAFVKQVERRARKALASKPSGERAAWLIDAWRYASRTESSEATSLLRSEHRRIAAYAAKAVKRIRDTGRLRHILSFATDGPVDRRLTRRCMDALLERDPNDPAARLQELLMSPRDAEYLRDPEKLLAILIPIRDRARREGLTETAARAQKLIESVQMMKRILDILPEGAAGAAIGQALLEMRDELEEEERGRAPRPRGPSRRGRRRKPIEPDGGEQLNLFDPDPEER